MQKSPWRLCWWLMAVAIWGTGCTEKKEKQPPPAKAATALDAKLDGAQKPKDAPPAQADFLGRLSLPGVQKIKPHWGRPLEELPALLVVKADYVHRGKKGVGRLLLDLNQLKTAKLALEPVPPLWAGLEEEGCAVGEAHLLFKGPAGLKLTTLTLTGFLSPPFGEKEAVFKMILEVKPAPQGQPFSLQVLPDHFAREAFGGGGKALKPLAKDQFAPLEELPDELMVTAGSVAWLPLSRHTPPKPPLSVGGPAAAGARVRIEAAPQVAARLQVSNNNDLGIFGLAPGEQTVTVVSVATGKKHPIQVVVRPVKELSKKEPPVRFFDEVVSGADAPKGPSLVVRQAADGSQEHVRIFSASGGAGLELFPLKGLAKVRRWAVYRRWVLVLSGETLSAHRLNKAKVLEKEWNLPLAVRMDRMAVGGNHLAMVSDSGSALTLWRLSESGPPVSEYSIPHSFPIADFFWRGEELWVMAQNGELHQYVRQGHDWRPRRLLPASPGTFVFEVLLRREDFLLADAQRGLLRFSGWGAEAALKETLKTPCTLSRIAPMADGGLLGGCLKVGPLSPEASVLKGMPVMAGATPLVKSEDGKTFASLSSTWKPSGMSVLATPWPGGMLVATVSGKPTDPSRWGVVSPQGQILKQLNGPPIGLKEPPKAFLLEGVEGILFLSDDGKLWLATP